MAEKLPGLRRSSINVLALWGQRAGGILVTIITTPIITNHFGLELVGIWLLVSQFSQHLTLLELGLNTSLTRFLASCRAKSDLVEASRYLSASVLVLLLMGAIVLLSAPLLADSFAVVFQLPSELATQVYWLVIVACLAVGLSLPLRVGIGLMSSRHRFDRIALWESLSLFTRLILIIACFSWFDPDLLFLGLITFIPSLIAGFLVFRDGRMSNRDLQVNYRLISKTVLWQMFSVGGATILITLSAVALRQTSPMIVGFELGTGQVAILAFPLLIVSAIMPFIAIANRLITPAASQLYAQQDLDELYRINIIVGRYGYSLALMTLVGIYYLGNSLFELWIGGPEVGSEVIAQMSSNLVVMFAGFALAVPWLVIRSVLVAAGKHWPAAYSELFGSLLGLAAGFWLLLQTELGVYGMAIGIFIAFMLRGLVFLASIGTRMFRVRYGKFIVDLMLVPSLIALLAWSLSKIPCMLLLYDCGVLSAKAVSIFIAASVWSICSWIWVVQPAHKQKLKAKLRSGF